MVTSNMSMDACAFGCLEGLNTNSLKTCQCQQSFYLGYKHHRDYSSTSPLECVRSSSLMLNTTISTEEKKEKG